MSILNCRSSDYVLFCGDTHDDNDIIPAFLKKYGITNASIFHVGDYGIGWETKEKEERKLLQLGKRLANSNSQLFVMRGNHDDPSWFKEYYSNGNVHLLPDYTVININGLNILCIGGAVSVDRTNKKEYLKKMNIKWWKNKTTRKGLSTGWWEDEIVVYNDIVKTIKDIDIVMTHTAPSFSTPYLKGGVYTWIENDKLLLKDLDDERQLMTKIYQELAENNNIKNWYYGHYHSSNTEYQFDTKFQLLNINEIVEHI